MYLNDEEMWTQLKIEEIELFIFVQLYQTHLIF